MHIPVLKEEVISLLTIQKGDNIVDATLGLGGHTKALLEIVGNTGTIIGIEWDKRNLIKAQNNLKKYSQVRFHHANYIEIDSIIHKEGLIGNIQAILFDLGISSLHIDEADRGFSFQSNGPLDMRFDTRQLLTASELINTWEEYDIAHILHIYGEEPLGRTIARHIIEKRKKKPILETKQLVDIIRNITSKKETLPRVFQAIRIAVNHEFDNIEQGLKKAFDCLAPGGKMAVISFHSLEDRIVKHFFKEKITGCICPPEIPICTCNHHPQASLVNKKPITPSLSEITKNPRSRSAKLRVIQKNNTPYG